MDGIVVSAVAAALWLAAGTAPCATAMQAGFFFCAPA
jgi:hypothetical protein